LINIAFHLNLQSVYVTAVHVFHRLQFCLLCIAHGGSCWPPNFSFKINTKVARYHATLI